MENLGLILLATGLISLGGLIGIVSLAVNQKRLERALLVLVSLSAGALMGGAFLHLLPEAVNQLDSELAFGGVLVVFIGFFLVEKVLHWHHCHKGNCEQKELLGRINLIGDSLHNFLDGLIIAAGGFIYIAASDLMPEIKKEESLRKSVKLFLVFLLGVGLMWALKLLEP